MNRFIFIVLFMCGASSGFKLVILHTNDVHARVEQTNERSGRCDADDAAEGQCFGGVSRRYTAIQELREKYEGQNDTAVVLLDGGDQFQGTLWFNEYRGLEASIFMNLLQYDAMVRHEKMQCIH